MPESETLEEEQGAHRVLRHEPRLVWWMRCDKSPQISARRSDRQVEQCLHFDTVARIYDAARPGYPALMIDDLLELSRASPGAHVLDIGCGTGKSTEPFARRGFMICALDPGANMLAVCKENLQSYPNVRYEHSAFETWCPGGQTFDLVISGTAFHWLTEAGYGQLMRVLKPQGAVGIFWHTFLAGQDPLYDELSVIYKKHAPALFTDDLQAIQEMTDRRKEEKLLSWRDFGEHRAIRYHDHVRYTTRGYVALLRTWSTHRELSESFFDAVALAIEKAGGEIIQPIRTTLCFARRAR
jgi:ubiquinone/menaquinone biosynthesis C-methylase UbiE